MQISVVIPVINEQARIQHAVERAWAAGANEVIVVDGHSTDLTAELAHQTNCSYFLSTPGRATQQNHGVQQAIGDVVLFLHADTWLPPNACDQIRQHLEDPTVIGGAFEQEIQSPRRLLKWIEKGNAFRVRWFNLAYGDQGIFVRKPDFLDLGGFPDVELMEDYMLSQRLRRRGRMVLLKGPLHVDARRWNQHGPIRQTLRNWLITLGFRLGIPPRKLAKFYRRHDIRPAKSRRNQHSHHEEPIKVQKHRPLSHTQQERS